MGEIQLLKILSHLLGSCDGAAKFFRSNFLDFGVKDSRIRVERDGRSCLIGVESELLKGGLVAGLVWGKGFLNHLLD